MGEHIGVIADFYLLHSVSGIFPNVNDMKQAAKLAHIEESDAYIYSDYQRESKHEKSI